MDSLIVSGEKRFEREEEGESFFFSEREYGAFQRAFRLPGDVDVNEVVADFKNSVLTITVPKTQPGRDDARRIPIRTE